MVPSCHGPPALSILSRCYDAVENVLRWPSRPAIHTRRPGAGGLPCPLAKGAGRQAESLVTGKRREGLPSTKAQKCSWQTTHLAHLAGAGWWQDHSGARLWQLPVLQAAPFLGPSPSRLVRSLLSPDQATDVTY